MMLTNKTTPLPPISNVTAIAPGGEVQSPQYRELWVWVVLGQANRYEDLKRNTRPWRPNESDAF